MKARVKATGEIVEVKIDYRQDADYISTSGQLYWQRELDFYVENKDPDYWTRLEHQYAGMALQGMSEKYLKDYRDYCAGFGDMDKDEAKATMKDFADAMADVCYYFAHALVEKYKKEERK